MVRKTENNKPFQHKNKNIISRWLQTNIYSTPECNIRSIVVITPAKILIKQTPIRKITSETVVRSRIAGQKTLIVIENRVLLEIMLGENDVRISEEMYTSSRPIMYVSRLCGLFPCEIRKRGSRLYLKRSKKYLVYSFFIGIVLGKDFYGTLYGSDSYFLETSFYGIERLYELLFMHTMVSFQFRTLWHALLIPFLC